MAAIKNINFLPRKALITLYQSLVESRLRYCNTVWVNCGLTLKNKSQSLQNSVVTRTKYDWVEPDQLLKNLRWLNVQQLIDFDTAAMADKSIINKAQSYLTSLFPKSNSVHNLSLHSTLSTYTPDVTQPAQHTLNLYPDVPHPAQHTLNLYSGCASVCTAHPQPVLRMCLSLYFGCTSACTADRQPVLRMNLSLHSTTSTCTPDVPQPVRTPSTCTPDVPQPVLHTLNLYSGCASACTAYPQPVSGRRKIVW